jgi:hypothetical protein
MRLEAIAYKNISLVDNHWSDLTLRYAIAISEDGFENTVWPFLFSDFSLRQSLPANLEAYAV